MDALALILTDAGTMRYDPVLFDRARVEDWIARNRRRYAASFCWSIVCCACRS